MYRKFFNMLSLLLVFVMVFSTFNSALADDGPIVPLEPQVSAETGEMVNETPSLWFVEMSGAPVADGNTQVAVNSEHQKFRDDAKKEHIEYKEEYSYDSLWNGFSVSATTAELGKLSRIAGVVAIYPVMEVSIPQTTTSAYDPELYTALAMTGADAAQSELGYTGKGIRVAVMDTGIDYDHKALGGDGVTRSNSTFFPNKRVIKGWDFVGDAYTGDNTPVPDRYPDDCNGHRMWLASLVRTTRPITSRVSLPKLNLVPIASSVVKVPPPTPLCWPPWNALTRMAWMCST
jgi:minor extracellular serine protease Vpr